MCQHSVLAFLSNQGLDSASFVGYLQYSLVAVTPREVLGADVLVRVLDTLLQRRHVAPVIPMLVPQNVRVDTCAD